MRNDPAAWVKGTVEIEIQGRFMERFLNLAFQDNVRLTGIRRQGESIFAFAELDQVRKLRLIARRSHCPFRIRRRFGMPFILAFLRKRPVLPLMAAAAIFMFFFVSSFIFTLEVTGPYPISEEDRQLVLELAEAAGVKAGRSRWGVDMEKAVEYIRDGCGDLVFAEIEEKGVHLTIQVVKRVDIPEDQEQRPPRDMIAVCDGIIRDVLVRKGTAAVSPGDAVCAGDVLIYGYDGKQGVAADGIVTASLWGEGYGECAAEEKGQELSGRSVLSLGIRINGGAYIHLLGSANSPYEQYRIEETVYNRLMGRKTDMLVEIISRKYGEVVTFFASYTPEEARSAARKLAAENAYDDLKENYSMPPYGNLQIVEERTSDIDLGDGLARAHTVLEGMAEIGCYRQNDALGYYIPEENYGEQQ